VQRGKDLLLSICFFYCEILFNDKLSSKVKKANPQSFAINSHLIKRVLLRFFGLMLKCSEQNAIILIAKKIGRW